MEKSSDQVSSKNKHIIVAEDNHSISMLIKFRLEKENFDVTQIYDGQKALESIRKNPPDLVILDIMLPELNGFEILRSIKQSGKLQNLKVLILSAKGREEDLVKGFKLEADEYMTKPFKIEELLVRIRQLI